MPVEATTPNQESHSARQLILDQFAAAVQQHTEGLAIVAAGRSLSYAALDRASDLVARKLADLHMNDGTLVGVMTERTIESAIAYMAILKAGAAFMPLPPDAPLQRNRLILRESRASVVLCTRNALHSSGAEDDYLRIAHFVDLETLAESGKPCRTISGAVPSGTAYVIFTSGSTGEPKGAANTNEALLNLVLGLAGHVYPAGAKRQNVAMVAPFQFDPSIQQFFGALLQGHCLHLVPEHARFDGGALLAFLNGSRIDIADGTPTHLRLLANAPTSLGNRLSPKLLLIGGEALTPEIISSFYCRFGDPEHLAIVNLYGTAECAVDSTAYLVDPAEIQRLNFVPIGQPLPNAGIRISDAAGNELPAGEAGEITITGTGVGSGYISRPELTRERFGETDGGQRFYRTGDLGIRHANGLFQCLGRLDRQIKIHGIRIEPGEIEFAIREFRRSATDSSSSVASCERCLLDTRHPGVTVTDGICSVCARFEAHQESATSYFRSEAELIRLLDAARSEKKSEEDCLLLYSGGKDSSYVLLRLIELGYRVATFTFDNGYISRTALENIDRTTKRYGVPHVTMTLAQMKEVFAESLRHESTVCDGCFRALTLLSTHYARQRGVNAVITGLSRGQIFETKLKRLFEQGMLDPGEIERHLQIHRQIFNVRTDPIARTVGLNEMLSPQEDKIHYIDFFRYDAASSADVLRYLMERDERWRAPRDTGFCSTNCQINDVGIHVHQLERGYHNYAAPLSWQIRLGVTTRPHAAAELDNPTHGPKIQNILLELRYAPRDASHGKIQDAAVVLRQGRVGQPILCGYFVSSGRVNVAELRDHLAKRLPNAMIPKHLIRVDEIPISKNGKVDFAKLPLPTIPEEPAVVKVDSEIEEKLCQLWREVLDLECISLDDNFFDLGGDSFLATTLVALIDSSLSKTTSVNEIFRYPCIREMARILASPSGAPQCAGPAGTA